jgi:predicted RNA-binding Zn-ribbon protein involved in translation (DUF1610 family)
MELQCPQCGKWMEVSQEELVIHDSQLVCPQCLAVCRYENGTLVVRIDSETMSRHTASVGTTNRDNIKYCSSCGKQLPGGISFCPYCGSKINHPDAMGSVVDVQPKPVVREPKVEKVEKVEERPQEKKKKAVENAPQYSQSSHVEDKLRRINRQYTNKSIHLHQNGTMPSTTVKVIAYTIIALLLILLVYIIIAGLSIEPAM